MGRNEAKAPPEGASAVLLRWPNVRGVAIVPYPGLH